MTECIVKFLKETKEPWLVEDLDTDAFPKPPTIIEWLQLIEELEATGQLVKLPNGRFLLPAEEKPSRVTNISGGQVIYNEKPNFGDQRQSSKTLQPIEETGQDKFWTWFFIILGGLASMATIYQIFFT